MILTLLTLLIPAFLLHPIRFPLLPFHLIQLNQQIIDIFHRLDSINPLEFADHGQSRDIVDVNLHSPLLPEEPDPCPRVVPLIDQLEVSVSEVNQHQSDRLMRVLPQLLRG